MGKYMKKTKSKSNSVTQSSVNAVEITSFGVRTRAKTLALRSQIQPPSPTTVAANGSSYLQLRNRRLLRERPAVLRNCGFDKSPNLIGNPNLCNSEIGAGCGNCSRVRVASGGLSDKLSSVSAQLGKGYEFDDSCRGENVVESEPRERSTRESTPSNMIKDPEAIHTPGSTTQSASSARPARQLRNSTQRSIPTSHEVDEFFSDAEEQQQREFAQKYNFDPSNDKPLPGRYEWEKMKTPGNSGQ